MNNIITALYEIKYNPFEYGAFLASFYAELIELEDNILLSSLVIPLCSHPLFGPKLFNSNIRSTIWSVFDDRAQLYDLQERIDGLQSLTDQCIQYCMVNDWLTVNEKSLSFHTCYGSDLAFINKKRAEKLGRLFSGHSVVEIYAFLGVKPR
ncbi:three component ABC system middle component [Photobacterium phosphoreum]|uniref:three component ABC system middle component n=1 Tax=Photobacterium phosphoreum TaxID=659 RepID=UPI000D1752A5|nr:three component ABC system middle component [Photobacterium phosphoreum]PSU57595.1 hypothetical protein CTM75_17750 [Photobacterium phosphoreum]PSU59980.1 hypothetical protein CTM80_15210 [Photobacterium phosphoreum]